MTNFKTRILDTAAFLIASGCDLIDIEAAYSSLYYFVFEDAPKCQKLENDFNNGGAVNAQALLSAKSYLLAEMRKRRAGE
jgi:hypothetical protein